MNTKETLSTGYNLKHGLKTEHCRARSKTSINYLE